MAAIIEAETQWHRGEEEMHEWLQVPHRDNPTQPGLSAHAARLLISSPLVAVGTLDSEDRPWTTIWGGEAGCSQPVAQSIIGMKATVDRTYDPVLRTLLGEKADGEVVRAEGAGKVVSGLGIDLESRNRVKLAGRMIAGALVATAPDIGDVQLVVKIEQSLGNCPKYLNKKHIVPHIPHPSLVSDSLPLPKAALDLIEKSDLFFISSSNHKADMDTNHRGGPQGFVRVLSNDENGVTLVYPEYSGNRLYQTLGNLKTTPRAGITFPDFDTGDVLYITGTTEVLAGKDASDLIAHTNLAVKIKVDAVRFVSDSLAFRGQEGERSPYNPPVRFLSSENKNAVTKNKKQVMAKLIEKKIITPTIGRFRFRIADPENASKWKPGQYVALSFADELDIGYSHMRDDDPKSLNDDFLRTFTVSSRQDVLEGHNEFEITIRKVGPVTDFLFRHNIRSELEVPLQGFGGEFFIQQGDREKVSFIAGGVGITPLLAQVHDLDLNRLNFYWTLRSQDLAFANDIFERVPGLAQSTTLFVTGRNPEMTDAWKKLTTSGATLERRRMMKDDITGDAADRWYMCTGPSFKNSVLEWMGGKAITYEDFNY
ncbi:oxidoreductase-like protein [Hyaloscypha variabilis]|uniref:Oxidoreductase-like protein n=1 Tax=Hyaloscypha variabilis (strain UAMH 11265 / GT02V1 / F) TaxID=1149755 RepID=A0A2J6RAX3_HYAVF|nr:oxidoreductase-like protein [Hyaloscypha variabilis F]